MLRFEPEVLPAGVRDLQSQLGERAFVIQRLRKFHGTPYQLSTAYVPESVGRQMRRNSLGSTSIITVLDRIGPKTVSSDHTMSAVAADDIASRALGYRSATAAAHARGIQRLQGPHPRRLRKSVTTRSPECARRARTRSGAKRAQPVAAASQRDRIRQTLISCEA